MPWPLLLATHCRTQRFALPQFEDGTLSAAQPGDPRAYFARLPSRRVLTLNLDVPETWLLEPAAALHDLDNLRLEDVPEQVAGWGGRSWRLWDGD